jgi:predicted RNA-binding Zn ribbon-like protein
MVTPASSYRWDFCGGHLALDLTNTVSSRGGDGVERLNHYADLLSWASARGVVTAGAARRLGNAADERPGAAGEALRAATALREALYRVIEATTLNRRIAATDLALLEAHLRASFARARLTPSTGRLALVLEPSDDGSLVAPILMPVVQAAMDLLTTSAVARVRVCAEPSCAWLFLDATRSATRRWCDMKVCGNRAKARRYRARH